MTVLQTISFCTVSALMKRLGGFFAHLNVLRASRSNFSDTVSILLPLQMQLITKILPNIEILVHLQF